MNNFQWLQTKNHYRFTLLPHKLEIFSASKPAYFSLEFKIGKRGICSGNKYKIACKDIFLSENLTLETVLYTDAKTGFMQEKIAEVNLYFLVKGSKVFGGQIRFDITKLLTQATSSKYICQELTKTTEFQGRLIFELQAKQLLVETPVSPVNERGVIYRSATPEPQSNRLTKAKPSPNSTADFSDLRTMKEENETLRNYVDQLEKEIKNKNSFFRKMKDEYLEKISSLKAQLSLCQAQLSEKQKQLDEKEFEIFKEFKETQFGEHFSKEEMEIPRSIPKSHPESVLNKLTFEENQPERIISVCEDFSEVVSEHEERQEIVKKAISRESEALECLKEELAQKKIALYKAIEAQRDAESENTHLKSRVNLLTSQLEQMRAEFHDCQSRNNALNHSLLEYTSRLKTTETELTKAKSQTAAIMNAIFEGGDSRLLDSVMAKITV